MRRQITVGRFTVVWLVAALVAGCSGAPRAGDISVDRAEENVTIPAKALDLVGTLRLPDSDAPYPGVVVVHGSGPQSRRGESPGQLGLTLPQRVPVYEELAEGLRDRGYAVLTFDKRSCGPFNGCADNGYPHPPEDLSFDVFADDVAAVVGHLAGRDDISGVSVIGHSKGGTTTTRLLDGGPELDAVVLLACPAGPIDQVLAEQADTLAGLVETAGQQGTAADEAVEQVRDLADEVAEVAAGELDGPDIGGVSRTFWAEWIEASRVAPSRVRDASVPVLALGGEQDWNVLPDQVLAWEAHLPADGDVRLLPSITHALTRLDVDDPALITPDDVGASVEPVVIETIADWLDTHAHG